MAKLGSSYTPMIRFLGAQRHAPKAIPTIAATAVQSKDIKYERIPRLPMTEAEIDCIMVQHNPKDDFLSIL